MGGEGGVIFVFVITSQLIKTQSVSKEIFLTKSGKQRKGATMHSRQCSHNVLILFGSPPPLPTKCPQQQKTLIFTLIAYHYQIHQKSTLTGQGFTHGRPYFFLCVRLANRNYNISVDIISLSLSHSPPLSHTLTGELTKHQHLT